MKIFFITFLLIVDFIRRRTSSYNANKLLRISNEFSECIQIDIGVVEKSLLALGRASAWKLIGVLHLSESDSVYTGWKCEQPPAWWIWESNRKSKTCFVKVIFKQCSNFLSRSSDGSNIDRNLIETMQIETWCKIKTSVRTLFASAITWFLLLQNNTEQFYRCRMHQIRNAIQKTTQNFHSFLVLETFLHLFSN